MRVKTKNSFRRGDGDIPPPPLPNIAPTVLSVSVSGTGQVGGTHRVSWAVSGRPIPSVEIIWKLDGVEIEDATGQTYVPDAEGALTAEIVATNIIGSHALESSAIDIFTTAELETPVITSVSIVGTRQPGNELTAVVAANGNPAPTLGYQWFANGTPISGAIEASYTPSTSISQLQVFVLAVNSEGSDSRLSAPIVIANPSGPAAPAAPGTLDWSMTAGAQPGSVVVTLFNLPNLGDAIVFNDGDGVATAIEYQHPGFEWRPLGFIAPDAETITWRLIPGETLFTRIRVLGYDGRPGVASELKSIVVPGTPMTELAVLDNEGRPVETEIVTVMGTVRVPVSTLVAQ